MMSTKMEKLKRDINFSLFSDMKVKISERRNHPTWCSNCGSDVRLDQIIIMTNNIGYCLSCARDMMNGIEEAFKEIEIKKIAGI